MKYVQNWLIEMEFAPVLAKYLSMTMMILFIGLICIMANFISKKVVIRLITHFVTNSKFPRASMVLKRRVFDKLSHIVPAIIIYYFATTLPDYQMIIEKAAVTYIIVVGLMVFQALLTTVNDIYQTYEISKTKPIKGYIQVVNIIVLTLGGLLVISNLMGESPLILLSGIGALSAVLMLVFKDSLLGLVAGIQLAANDMVRVGDWIEMPKYGADGNIIDISLNTVMVQNFDKTITSVPSYALISDSFINWRGMESSGGRRIKRSILLDTSSISFCSGTMLEKCKQIHYLTDYVTHKEREISEYNTRFEMYEENKVNGRSLTNIGMFRVYIQNYLKSHPGINQDMTLLVRQLPPSEHGLPIEIYAFTKDIRWEAHESIQSDIFDHLLAVASEFELKVFQNPTGNDLKSLLGDTISKPVRYRSVG
ncbi:miniconductance mechanosensitive channel [Bacillus mesophilus]|uniref:Mechanosensing system component YbdG n=1 Tax=Bacillus mesophilus TaxID=1808955 RepID=A0A6M0Q5B7_9BACI|nr:mechanosensitive ion channel family protein [Bacillus mesophilus]MBM7660264.1 miniconductance mechanosensitive channel [Bacillus mesophilus]NEY70979.1 mechanosensitive ion channel family protein [Bacillus mesophilus]